MRLIDADALDLDREVEMADDWKTAHEMANLIKYAPTIEAQAVSHGEWIRQDDTFTKFMCSNCKTANQDGFGNYCKHCGADMRKKV